LSSIVSKRIFVGELADRTAGRTVVVFDP